MSQFEKIDQMEQDKQPPKAPKQSKLREVLKGVGAHLRSFLLENWGTKLVSILIAIALWAGLIAQDPTLTREKNFENADINIIGQETLKRNGYIVLEDLDEVLDDVDISVSVPQGQYSAAQAGNYSVRIDLSRIKQAGKQEVRILSTNTSTYGTVTRVSPASVMLTVDEYVTRYRIPVTVSTTGESPAGFWADEPSTDPPQVAISGPKSLVDQVAWVQVVADQSALPAKEGKDRRAVPFTLVDASGAPIQSSLLEVTSEGVLLDSVIVEQQIFPTRLIEISELGVVQGEPARGYEVKGVYITPAVLTIAGRGSIIGGINMFYADKTVDIEGLTQSVSEVLRVRQPVTVRYVSTDQVDVAVEIGPVMMDRSWDYVPVMVRNMAPGMDVEMNISSVTLHVTGAQLWVETLQRADVQVWCDLGGITEAGDYENLPLMCTVTGDEGQTYTCTLEPATVAVKIIPKEGE